VGGGLVEVTEFFGETFVEGEGGGFGGAVCERGRLERKAGKEGRDEQETPFTA
jgi:hypothetical protein